MRTEKELLAKARHFQLRAIAMIPHGDPTSRRKEGEYKVSFDAIAWFLKWDSFDLWTTLLKEDSRDEIPLFTRLSRLTNPPQSGRILEPKE